MIITIDTSKDSREDILKVIKMLQSLAGSVAYTNQPSQSNTFEQPTPELLPGNVLGDFFGNIDNSRNLSKLEKKDEDPKVMEYY